MHKSSRIRLLPQQLFAGIRLIFDKQPNFFDEEGGKERSRRKGVIYFFLKIWEYKENHVILLLNLLNIRIMTVLEKQREQKASLKEEALETMLNRAGITKKDIYKVALTNWINKNLDLLTPSELTKYKEIII